ncbi:MAG: hypothetical protein ACLT98_15835 [Eggerthellaceae bacterium]
MRRAGAADSDETLPSGERYEGTVLGSVKQLGAVARNKVFSAFLGIVGLYNLPFMAYIAVGSYVYITFFGLTELEYSMYFAFAALLTAAGPFIWLAASRFMSARRFTSILLGIALASGAAMLAVGQASPQLFCITFLAFALTEAAVRPYSTNVLLSQQEGDTGAASSLINFAHTAIGCVGMLAAVLRGRTTWWAWRHHRRFDGRRHRRLGSFCCARTCRSGASGCRERTRRCLRQRPCPTRAIGGCGFRISEIHYLITQEIPHTRQLESHLAPAARPDDAALDEPPSILSRVIATYHHSLRNVGKTTRPIVIEHSRKKENNTIRQLVERRIQHARPHIVPSRLHRVSPHFHHVLQTGFLPRAITDKLHHENHQSSERPSSARSSMRFPESSIVRFMASAIS